MTSKEWSALQRLLIIVTAWAAAEAVLRLVDLGAFATLGGALAAVAAYLATRGGLPARRRGGDDNIIYWRGRRIDRDKLN